MQIFIKMKYLYKKLQTAITPSQNLWDIITIVIILNLLQQDFDITTTSLLETDNKMIN